MQDSSQFIRTPELRRLTAEKARLNPFALRHEVDRQLRSIDRMRRAPGI